MTLIGKRMILKVAIIIIFTAVFSGCAGMFADSLVYPNRQPIVKVPSDYGMDYTDVEYLTPDNVAISGWLIPGTNETIAIMVPPMNFTKYGYSIENQGKFKITDIEVEFLNTAKSLNKEGYTVFTFDLRNHGESGEGNNGIFGLGNYEYNDVLGALEYIDNSENLRNKEIFFVSYCTGANATILAMKNNPEAFKNVKCMAAVQPISTEVFVTNFMDDKYPFFKWMIPSIEKNMIKKGSDSFNELSPSNYIDGLFIPTLFVQAEEDKWTDTEYIKSLYDEADTEKEMYWLKGDKHRFDTYNLFGHSPEVLLTYVNQYISK